MSRKIYLWALARKNLAVPEAIAMKKIPLQDMKINWNWTCPLTGKQEIGQNVWNICFHCTTHSAECSDPSNIPGFLPGGTFQTTRKVGPSRGDNLAEMKTKKSEFGEAEMAGIFETEYQRRGTYTVHIHRQSSRNLVFFES